MALNIKGELVINSSNDELTFNDLTGDYGVSNLTGFGGGVNKPKANIVKTQIRVIKPDGTYVDFDLNSSTTPSTDFVPVNSITRKFTLSDLGISSDLLEDGAYIVHYITWISITATSVGAFKQTVSGKILSKLLGVGTTFGDVLIGFGDTSVLRAVQVSDTTKYEDFTIKEIVDGLNITLEQDSANFGLIADGASVPVILYAGYKSTFATLNKEQFLACFLPKIAGITLIGSKGCGDPSCATFKADKEIADLTEMHLGLFSIEAQMEYGMWDEANKNMRTLTKICNSCKCCC